MDLKQIEINVQSIKSSGKVPAFSYGRISTEKQDDRGNSLEYQKDNAEIAAFYKSRSR